jgi:hypothetical protein
MSTARWPARGLAGYRAVDPTGMTARPAQPTWGSLGAGRVIFVSLSSANALHRAVITGVFPQQDTG